VEQLEEKQPHLQLALFLLFGGDLGGFKKVNHFEVKI